MKDKPWYDKSLEGALVNGPSLRIEAFLKLTKCYDFAIKSYLGELLKAYDAKCDELITTKEYIEDTEAFEEFMTERILDARRRDAKTKNI